MSDLLTLWLRPESIVALGVIINIIQQWRSTHRITKLEINTNSIQSALNEAKVAEGRVIERNDARDRAETGKPT